MREYSIVLPTHDNDGTCLATLHIALKRELIANFDGYSATAQTGGWVNAEGELFEEPSFRYTVAVDHRSRPHVHEEMLDIACKIGLAAKQQAIYVCLDGQVTIIGIGA